MQFDYIFICCCVTLSEQGRMGQELKSKLDLTKQASSSARKGHGECPSQVRTGKLKKAASYQCYPQVSTDSASDGDGH